ncbi:NPCBM-associated, NEW3 domain of alpha-galactosidase [Georgenia satyanarayanai]|uniref:NPCBM-associated, NEW3 domain of alpha-galactosidase n=1 Tax=Georgenia satyanarayanai TaxID=860221 RepID=A0A2Y9ALU2_9MICO|nr:sugar-binding protein [Georgenia satyanarayanai]PYF99241.1 alpha-galactosidase-like protein [Georgenia satyanarayanai]SSA43359.1 NPCBM-associated, NEW3 domain of alpha-galactosidase [Georgenia satyanarayanai]
MKRRVAAAALAALVLGALMPTAAGEELPPLTVDEPSIATEVEPNKIDVMGLWAHPDDDAGFTTPCGVWHDRYDVQCGIIMLTRGEGGSNSVGDEAGPALGLRRENEDRASHYRSGTVDIYNIDAVDFFYNTSAALTEEVWGSERVQRQVVHVIRQTRPEILTGFSPAPAGHGNHQYAGRVIWEAAQMAADPTAFPEQLTGPDAVDVWQVKVITSGASTAGEGGTDGPSCNAGFVPAPTNPFTVVGTWSGYPSPYTWLPGNVQGQEPGSAQTWAQVGREGNRAHPTQARTKHTGIWEPQCLRYGIAHSEVPFQPNGSPENARDDAILFGSVIADPGGMPLGSTFSFDVADNFQAPGVPFDVTVESRAGSGTIAAGDVTLEVPVGWTVSEPQRLGPIGTSAESGVTFTVTPAEDAATGRHRLAARFDNGTVTAYNDTRVDIVPGVEGRFERWGNFAEYDEWAEAFTYVSGRSPAETRIGAGETITVPVVVTNRTTEAQDGEVTLTAPAPLEVAPASVPFADLAPGEDTTVELTLTHPDPSAPGGQTVDVPITTTTAGSTSTENLVVRVVPTTVVPEAGEAPAVDGEEDAGYGEPIDIGRRWEGAECDPDGTDCGAGSYARLAWSEDDLYVLAHVVDDVASAAATPERCFGHWLVDSVEVLLDPQATSRDTSTTFKTGIMPFTDDPTGAAGNGPDGPCWSRDADAHQGFSSGPLADTVEEAPNSPGQEVAVSVARGADGSYAGGSYTVETKIPLANLPAAVGPTSTAPTGDATTNDVDPQFLGLNVTPYDSDNQDFIGETRTAWSPFGSQQSEPYRWGHAYLDDYEPPADRPTEPADPVIPDTALMGVESPQTIYQSAVRGVTISGLPASHGLTVADVEIDDPSVTLSLDATEAGTVRAFVWQGDLGMVPVWVSSCEGDELGFSACSEEDGAAAPWAPDMGGRLLGAGTTEVAPGTDTLTVEIGDDALDALRADGSVLVSFQAADGGVDAWHFPVVEGEVPTEEPTEEPTTAEPTQEPTSPAPTDGPTTPGEPTTPPAAGGPLPSTGADVGTVVLVAVLLAVAGGAVALVARHRRSR